MVSRRSVADPRRNLDERREGRIAPAIGNRVEGGTRPCETVGRLRGSMAYGYTMRLMVDSGHYADPESWESLDASVREAWNTIGTDWLQRMPKDSRIRKLIAEGFIDVEDE